MNQMKIESQVWLRDDLHNILKALALTAPSGEWGDGFRAALTAVATATAMQREQPQQSYANLNSGWEDVPASAFWGVR